MGCPFISNDFNALLLTRIVPYGSLLVHYHPYPFSGWSVFDSCMLSIYLRAYVLTNIFYLYFSILHWLLIVSPQFLDSSLTPHPLWQCSILLYKFLSVKRYVTTISISIILKSISIPFEPFPPVQHHIVMPSLALRIHIVAFNLHFSWEFLLQFVLPKQVFNKGLWLHKDRMQI